MLRLPKFQLRRAASVSEAVAMLAAEGACEGRARPVAGGTDLWPNMKRRHQRADVVISLAGIADLTGIRSNGDLTIGANTTLSTIETDTEVRHRFPALARAVASISSPPLRNMGTLGGNLCVDTRCTYYNQTEEWRRSIDYCMKEAGSTCWVAPSSPRCWAHSASDSAPMLAALGAQLTVVGPQGERQVAVEGLFRDDGMEYLAKTPEELVTAIRIPRESARWRSAFWKLRRRGSIDFAVLSVGAALDVEDDGTIRDARIFLGAVASLPVAAEASVEALRGEPATAEVLAAAAALARRNATPMDNTDFQAQWRGAVVQKYVEAALRECVGLPTERQTPKHRLV
ncbi:MAG: FAD binding domain-containing protein [Acidobacteriota bacterium]